MLLKGSAGNQNELPAVNFKVNIMLHLLTITPDLLALQLPDSNPERPPGWQLQARCNGNDKDSCVFLQQVLQLSKTDKRDGQAALQAMAKLFQVAATGHPLERFYDQKQCHESHVFNHKGVIYKIWRIRQGAVRIYFYYASGKIIYLSAVAAKRTDRLSKADKKRLEDEITLYLEAEASSTLVAVS